MLTEQSTLKQLRETPVGHDIIATLKAQAGIPAVMLDNLLADKLPLSALAKLGGKELVGTILRLANSERDLPAEKQGEITRKWWKEAVVYQIYPRSFQDTDGDGVGDLPGILRRLPYLKALGVDVLWLSPIYDSPNDDNGYDIRDYRAIMPAFGTMADFDALLCAVHENGMKLIMDLVVNHTSDEHPWFQEAMRDENAPEHDYYIFKKGVPDMPPNNWVSFFSTSAWNWYPERGEWGLHLFSKKQMDLNWENPAVRREVHDLMRFWFDKGIDGFRMDVINLISKDGYTDGNALLGKATGLCGIEHYFYGPRLHEYLREMREQTMQGRDVFTVGETPGVGMEMCKLLTGEERQELDMVFNFDHFENPGKKRFDDYAYDLNALKQYYLDWQQQYGNGCWMSLVLENHDNPRMVSKVNANPAVRVPLAKLLCTLLMTLKGTPFLYQGQELGMVNIDFQDIGEINDVESRNLYDELCKTQTPQEAFATVLAGTRDHARSPIPWDGSRHADFTNATPWLRMGGTQASISVSAEENDADSPLSFYKAAIALRKASPALIYGDFAPCFAKRRNLFCYFRTLEGAKFYIECNLSAHTAARPVPIEAKQVLVLSNYGTPHETLRPYEANVYRVTP